MNAPKEPMNAVIMPNVLTLMRRTNVIVIKDIKAMV